VKIKSGKEKRISKKEYSQNQKTIIIVNVSINRSSLSLTFTLPPLCNFTHTLVQITPLLTSSATENYLILICKLPFTPPASKRLHCKEPLDLLRGYLMALLA